MKQLFAPRFDHHIDSSSFANTLGHHNPHLDQWPLNSSLVVSYSVRIRWKNRRIVSAESNQ